MTNDKMINDQLGFGIWSLGFDTLGALFLRSQR